MTDRGTPAPRSDGSRDLVVEFYESEEFLTDSLTAFLVPALTSGEAVIVIATAVHRRRLEAALSAAGVDSTEAASNGRYVAVDPVVLLRRFMVAGRPDAGRFRDTVGPMIDGAREVGTRVRIYSEMVAQLHAKGEVAATVALGELWQRLKVTHEFALLCAYPMRTFARDQNDAVFEQICAQHNVVIPSDSYPLGASRNEQERAVARLQRELAALRANMVTLRAEHERLDQLAHVDELTGLGNRRAFDRHLDREWQLARRSRSDSLLILADVDRFKGYNDRFGHATGDELLGTVAEALRSSARNTDIVCRIGGDEFAAVLIGCEESDWPPFTGRTRAALADAKRPRLGEIALSIGYSSLLQAPSPAEALERADTMMYAAKGTSGQRRRTNSRRGRPTQGGLNLGRASR